MSFQDIKGQDKPIQILKSYIEQDHLKGGYLFVGPEAVGKKSIAKTLAKAVNCQASNLDTSTTLECHGERTLRLRSGFVPSEVEGRSRTIDSCDRCISCIKIEKNQHPDVHIIDATTLSSIDIEQNRSDAGGSDAIKIGHIRQLQKDISLKPYEGKKKVFIIDDAHNLTQAASGALLKILEEPPQDSLIILISNKPILLFKTIISRCKVLKFYSLARPELENIFKKDFALNDNTAHFLAYFSEGRLGCALRLKDTDILNEKNRIIDQIVFSRKANINNLLIQNREDMRAYLNILVTWFRDIYLLKVGIGTSEIINFDRRDDLLKVMSRFSFLDLDQILNSISDSILYLGQNINIKLLLSNLKYSMEG
jgi:DNA polymerase-3 subunit delta'